MRSELRAGFMLIMQIGASPGRVGPSGGIIGANEIPIPPLDYTTSTL
jgi:hypothetical protein